MIKTAIIKKLENGQYRLYSKKKDKDGKRRNLGTFDSLKGAQERERQVQFFKSQADDGRADDKNTKMMCDLSNIAEYLEEAGFTDKADLVYGVMNAIDGGLEQGIIDQSPIPDDQMNTENQGYMGGESPIAGGYSGFSADVAQLTDDSVDMVSASNGLQNNTAIDNQNSTMTSVMSDSYLNVGYEELEGPYR